MSGFIKVANNGQDITETNYWDSELAQRGLFFLSGNAGALRLLVPDNRISSIGEMKTGRFVTIERSQVQHNAVDAVFEDMTDRPFYVALDKRAQIDRAGLLQPKDNVPFSVWTRAGKVLTFLCGIKRGA
jgi:hypothetical protein